MKRIIALYILLLPYIFTGELILLLSSKIFSVLQKYTSYEYYFYFIIAILVLTIAGAFFAVEYISPKQISGFTLIESSVWNLLITINSNIIFVLFLAFVIHIWDDLEYLFPLILLFFGWIPCAVLFYLIISATFNRSTYLYANEKSAFLFEAPKINRFFFTICGFNLIVAIIHTRKCIKFQQSLYD